VDLIFVHGLRGGSVKTWSKNDDDQYFWPQAWLPQEPDLQHARIHTFGYNSDWGERRESILNVHDFGKDLLGEMSTNPYLRAQAESPIILIGHSMGGLGMSVILLTALAWHLPYMLQLANTVSSVIKKAYILARRDNATKGLAARVQCLMFLATPHRGASLASLLSNILRAAGVFSVKPFLSDLEKNSPGLDMINDEFRHYADDVRLWSFYETLRLNIGVQSVLIVEKDSASIGFKHERILPLHADHRTVCKFDSVQDSNYIKVKNALASIIEDMLGETLVKKEDEERFQISALQTYLGVTDRPIDELNNEQDNQVSGSCSWIEDRGSFRLWLEASAPVPPIYWIHAQPATGKTVLTGHVITHLQDNDRDCSYYFFKHGRKGSNTLSAMLRSFAFQMALMHPAVRQVLANMQQYSIAFDKDDERVIWRKLFTGTIFKVPLDRPQYWIIDALDECSDPLKLFPLLARIESSFAVQIFITSRPLPEFERQFNRLGCRVTIDIIPVEDTTSDIRLFFMENVDTLPAENEVDRMHLVEKLLRKSTGCFLWARLVLQELQSVYSEDYIEEVIDELPVEMGPLYERILNDMSRNVREKRLARALLVWAVCAIRPLQTSELVNAIKIDDGINVPSLERSVQGLCGQLLHVDKTGCVQVMHMTTRTFLTDGSLESEFAVSKEEGNRRLALTCLTYLSGEEMRPPRNRTVLNFPRKTKSVFADYACVAFSEHIANASSTDNNLFLALEKFLRSNVLAWIEYIAKTKQNLYYLTRTAKNLQKYLSRRAKHTPPLGDAYRYVNQWATDLVRLAAKFGRNLLAYPESIYYLITPFCPRGSAIGEMFADHSGLTVAGLANDAWEDSISYIDFRDNRAMSVAAGDNTFAIGTKSGRIFLYWQTTCQERMTLEHGESAKVLSFDNSHRLASAGAHKIRLWDLDSKSLIWTHEIKDTPVLIQFAPDDSFLIAATRRSHALGIACDDGKLLKEQSFPNQQAPLDVAISPDCRMVAFAYRGKAVLLWSLDNDQLLGACGGKVGSTDMISNSSPQQVIFNSNPAVELMVVTFQNGNMILYETWNQRAVKAAQQDCHYMACSPDGRTLATGSSWGALGLWDFETLTLLYQINTRETLGKALSFTACGTRIIELRDRKTKVWEPAVLVRKASEEDSSISESVTLPTHVGEGQEDIVPITSACVHPTQDIIFVGKDDGTTNMYSALTGELQCILYSHKQDIFVRKIASSASNVVASEDASNTVMAYEFEERPGLPPSTKKLLNRRFDFPVQQLVLNSTGDRLLVSTATTDSLWSLDPETGFTQTHTLDTPSRTIWRWMSSTRIPGTVLLVADQTIRRFTWLDLSELTHSSPLRNLDIGATDFAGSSDLANTSDLTLKALATDPSGTYLIAEYAHKLGSKATSRFCVWHADGIESSTSSTPTAPLLLLASSQIKHFLGMFGQHVVFLNHALWVCSVDLKQGEEGATKKHFFVPLEFVGGNEGSMGCVSWRGGVVFPKEGEVAVVRDGLEWGV
jgi:WD40 repeat protein